MELIAPRKKTVGTSNSLQGSGAEKAWRKGPNGGKIYIYIYIYIYIGGGGSIYIYIYIYIYIRFLERVSL